MKTLGPVMNVVYDGQDKSYVELRVEVVAEQAMAHAISQALPNVPAPYCDCGQRADVRWEEQGWTAQAFWVCRSCTTFYGAMTELLDLAKKAPH